MTMRVTMAIVTAASLAGAAGIANAQGYVTQDPGSHAPRNLTLQYLGPSGAGVTIPGEPDTGDTWPLSAPTGRGAVGATPGYGSSSTPRGAGNPSGLGGGR
jgi:hypothetical protein